MKGIAICGLGAHPPQETTLETLQTLEDCSIVFTDVADSRVRDWLKGYCRSLRRPSGAAQIVSAAKRSSAGEIGLAVWGHPQFSSRLAKQVQQACRSVGVSYRVLGAISPVASAFARSASFLGGDYGYQGIQAYELKTLLSRPQAFSPDLPLVVYSEKAPSSSWRRLLAFLRRGFDGGHQVKVYPVGGGKEQTVAVGRLNVSRLSGAVILVPPVSRTGDAVVFTPSAPVGAEVGKLPRGGLSKPLGGKGLSPQRSESPPRGDFHAAGRTAGRSAGNNKNKRK